MGVPFSSTGHARRGGFSLLELLAVIAIISILMVLVVPALNSIVTNYRITDTAARLAAMIERGRIHATVTQRVVGVRFFAGSNPEEFTATTLVEMTPVPGTNAMTTNLLTRYFRFPEPIILSKSHSSLLADGSAAGTNSTAVPGDGVRAYRDFCIFPDGSTSLSNFSTNPCLGILKRTDTTPDNPCVLSIDPVTCRVTTYRK